MSTELKLLPCPFCGMEITTTIPKFNGKEIRTRFVFVDCSCGVSFRIERKNMPTAWNLRTDPVRDELVAAARGAADAIEHYFSNLHDKDELARHITSIRVVLAKAEGGA